MSMSTSPFGNLVIQTPSPIYFLTIVYVDVALNTYPIQYRAEKQISTAAYFKGNPTISAKCRLREDIRGLRDDALRQERTIAALQVDIERINDRLGLIDLPH